MKKHYSLIFAILITTTSILAQNFTYTPSKDIDTVLSSPNFTVFQIDIATPTPEAIQYKYTTISNSFHPGWICNLCIHGGCAVGIPASGTMDEITLIEALNGVVGFFKLHLTVGNNIGHGVARIYVYDANDVNRGDTVSFDIDRQQITDIKETTYSPLLSIYPNPAKETIRMNNKSNYNVNIEIYNILGESVAIQMLLPNQSSKLDVSSIKKGVYFVLYTDEKGIKQTQKLILQ
jgi:hypothetical protein